MPAQAPKGMMERLKEVLRRGREEFGQYWEEGWGKVHGVYARLVDRVIRGEDPRSWRNEDYGDAELQDEYKDIYRLFWFIFGVRGAEGLSDRDVEKFREFLGRMREANSESEAAEIIREYEGKIKGLGIISLATWASIVHPGWFAPLWGNPRAHGGPRGVINSHSAPILGVDASIQSFDQYDEVLTRIRRAAREVGIDNMVEASFYLSMTQESAAQDFTVMVGNVAWSHSGWRGFDKEGYRKKDDYGFRFVKETGIAHEWWNFHDFDEEWYYGHLEWGERAPAKLKGGLILFVSRKIDDGEFYFVGFYGDAEIGEFNTGRRFTELLPEEYINDIQKLISEAEKYREYLEKLPGSEYVANIRAPKRRSVVFREYLKVEPQDLGVKKFGQWSFKYLDKNLAAELLRRARDQHELLLNEVGSEGERREVLRIIRAVDDVLRVLEYGWIGEMRRILEHKKQIILYGPPGTGKTWLARKFVEGAGGRSDFVTFHPSYSYEEFVEGLRPAPSASASGGGVEYVVEDGIFKRVAIKAICEALRHAGGEASGVAERVLTSINAIESGSLGYDEYAEGKRALWSRIESMSGDELRKIFSKAPRFYLVIDEINRGDVSKIFGELITLIEVDKRLGGENQIVVRLPYSKEPLAVPPNLYIIGTMNTADRSIALMDVALRRRFGFMELMPDYEVLEKELLDDDVPNDAKELRKLAIKVLRSINKRIKKEYDRDHQIGHSYFLKLKECEDKSGTEEVLKHIWYHEIVPLLQEYFYDSPEKLKEVLKGKFVRVEGGCPEFVEEEEFIRALKEVAEEVE